VNALISRSVAITVRDDTLAGVLKASRSGPKGGEMIISGRRPSGRWQVEGVILKDIWVVLLLDEKLFQKERAGEEGGGGV